jgi:tetratricopeptide (TPR) repeat protein
LESVQQSRDSIIEKSKEEDKKYRAFFLTTRIRELYIRCGRFKEGKEADIKRVTTFLENVAQNRQVDSAYIPLILNHLICSVELGEFDNTLFEVIKLLNPSEIPFLTLEGELQFTDDESERTLFAGYAYDYLVKALITFLKMLANDPNTELLQTWSLGVSHLFYEHVNTFYGEEDNQIEQITEFITDFGQLQDSLGKNALLKEIIGLYQNLASLCMKETEISAFEQAYSVYTSDKITSSLVKVLNLVDDSFIRKYIKNLHALIKDVKGVLTYSYEADYMMVLINLYFESSCSQLKKGFLREFVYDTSRIEALHKLKQHEIICTLFFEYRDKINMESFFFEVAFSLHEKGYLEDAKKVYEYGIKSGKGGSACYNNLSLIYEKEQDLGKAHYYLEKALKLDHESSKAKSNLSRVKASIQKARSARKSDIFVSTAADVSQAKKKIAIAPSVFNIPDKPL